MSRGSVGRGGTPALREGRASGGRPGPEAAESLAAVASGGPEKPLRRRDAVVAPASSVALAGLWADKYVAVAVSFGSRGLQRDAVEWEVAHAELKRLNCFAVKLTSGLTLSVAQNQIAAEWHLCSNN